MLTFELHRFIGLIALLMVVILAGDLTAMVRHQIANNKNIRGEIHMRKLYQKGTFLAMLLYAYWFFPS